MNIYGSPGFNIHLQYKQISFFVVLGAVYDSMAEADSTISKEPRKTLGISELVDGYNLHDVKAQQSPQEDGEVTSEGSQEENINQNGSKSEPDSQSAEASQHGEVSQDGSNDDTTSQNHSQDGGESEDGSSSSGSSGSGSGSSRSGSDDESNSGSGSGSDDSSSDNDSNFEEEKGEGKEKNYSVPEESQKSNDESEKGKGVNETAEVEKSEISVDGNVKEKTNDEKTENKSEDVEKEKVAECKNVKENEECENSIDAEDEAMEAESIEGDKSVASDNVEMEKNETVGKDRVEPEDGEEVEHEEEEKIDIDENSEANKHKILTDEEKEQEHVEESEDSVGGNEEEKEDDGKEEEEISDKVSKESEDKLDDNDTPYTKDSNKKENISVNGKQQAEVLPGLSESELSVKDNIASCQSTDTTHKPVTLSVSENRDTVSAKSKTLVENGKVTSISSVEHVYSSKPKKRKIHKIVIDPKALKIKEEKLDDGYELSQKSKDSVQTVTITNTGLAVTCSLSTVSTTNIGNIMQGTTPNPGQNANAKPLPVALTSPPQCIPRIAARSLLAPRPGQVKGDTTQPSGQLFVNIDQSQPGQPKVVIVPNSLAPNLPSTTGTIPVIFPKAPSVSLATSQGPAGGLPLSLVHRLTNMKGPQGQQLTVLIPPNMLSAASATLTNAGKSGPIMATLPQGMTLKDLTKQKLIPVTGGMPGMTPTGSVAQPRKAIPMPVQKGWPPISAPSGPTPVLKTVTPSTKHKTDTSEMEANLWNIMPYPHSRRRAIPNYHAPPPPPHLYIPHTLYKCLACCDEFAISSSYKDHMERKSMLINHPCEICKKNYTFYNMCRLAEHIKRHDRRNRLAGTAWNINVSIKPLNKELLSFGARVGDCAINNESVGVGGTATTQKSTDSSSEGGSSNNISNMTSNNISSAVSALNSADNISGQIENTGITSLEKSCTLVQTDVSGKSLVNGVQHKISLKEGSCKKDTTKEGPATTDTSEPSNLRVDEAEDVDVLTTDEESKKHASPPIPDSEPRPYKFGRPPRKDSIVKKNVNLICPECDCILADQKSFDHHFRELKSGEEITQHQCGVCQMALPSKCSLSAHKRTHGPTSRPHVCPECGHIIEGEVGVFFKHLTNKCMHFSRTIKFKCPTCDTKSITSTKSLEEHIKQHR